MDDFLKNLKNFSREEKTADEGGALNEEEVKDQDTEQSFEAITFDYNTQRENILKSNLPKSIKESFILELDAQYQHTLMQENKKKEIKSPKKESTSLPPSSLSNQQIRQIFKEEFEALFNEYFIVEKNTTEIYIKIGDTLFKGNLKKVDR